MSQCLSAATICLLGVASHSDTVFLGEAFSWGATVGPKLWSVFCYVVKFCSGVLSRHTFWNDIRYGVQALGWKVPHTGQVRSAAYALALRHLPPRASHTVSKVLSIKPASSKAQTESFQSWWTAQLTPSPVHQTIKRLPAANKAWLQTTADTARP